MADFNHWSAIADALPKATSAVVRKTAFDIQAQAAAAAPVDTGFLKSSIYVVTSQESTYGQANSPPKDATLLPQVEAPTDDQTAFIGVGASYGIYNEMGTTRMPAHPYFTPAVEAARGPFEDAMSKIESALNI